MEAELSLPAYSMIGEELTVIPVEEDGCNGRNIFYNCREHEQFDTDWHITVSAPADDPLTLGDPVEAWIFAGNPQRRQITLTTDDFGRADMHSLEERHIEAADHIVRLVLLSSITAGDVDLDKVSWAKGMLSRCVRKDQWDWYTVFHLLGKPPRSQLQRGRDYLTKLRSAAKEGKDDEAEKYVSLIAETHLARRFMFFSRRATLGEEYGVISHEWLVKQLYKMDPATFEEFVSDCWQQLGWESRVTTPKQDLGVDIVAERDGVLTEKCVIQVKRWNPERVISLSDVQRYASIRQQGNADIAYLITTATFSREAVEAAENLRLKLLDGETFAKFVQEQELHQVVDKYIGLESNNTS